MEEEEEDDDDDDVLQIRPSGLLRLGINFVRVRLLLGRSG
jgi:hypothetical protein